MFPQINNKSLLECEKEDFAILLNNSDYRESSYLEYKSGFSFICCSEEKRKNEITEFRNDICSFANANGGYIIYGIKEDNGIASELLGIEIDDTDKFELNLRNKLVPIMPKIPPISIKCVLLDKDTEKYLVVILIEHDFYAPYIHIENEKNYKIYKHDGNRKTTIGYAELKNMFTQSKILEDEIFNFRKKRIEYYNNVKGGQFVIFHIIPDSFLDVRKMLFVMEKKEEINFATVFQGTRMESVSLPCVDGLRFNSTDQKEEGIIYNNGIVEYVLSLEDTYITGIDVGYFFCKDDIWGKIEGIAMEYRKLLPRIFNNFRYFGCISVLGCKNTISEDEGHQRYSYIDRDEIICAPICFVNGEDTESYYINLDKLLLEFYLSIGVRKDPQIKKIIDGVNI